ncbi:hypothetical protein niasHS_011807 [Heterodera schachtii]|uniref:DNA-directed DNA polymerase n=1 Tax=Heterodera schachtii TaxID=97005 RepID=A0ABD2IBH2_HETSC
MKTEKKKTELTIELMEKAGISMDSKSFGIQHLEAVQKFWDKEFPDTFRIVAFDMFYNPECFEAHKKAACKEYKKCENLPPKTAMFHQKNSSETAESLQNCAYDLETTVEGGEHRPNLVSAALTCSICAGEKRKCEICEEPKKITWSVADGFDPMSEFVVWIMGFRRFETIAFAHYAGRFDSHFVLSELTKKEIATELMMADLKIYQIKAGRVNFRDFWMFREQLKIYCENDVEILMQSILKFRQLFLEITGDFDAMKDSVTIAGVVMKIFRAKFLKDRHIPIMPEGGYEKAENQSKIAVRYFEWLAQRKGVSGMRVMEEKWNLAG